MNTGAAMSMSQSEKPVGVRAVTGERAGRLVWVAAGACDAAGLERGTRVVVQDADHEWLGEVVMLPGLLLEVPVIPSLPYLVRAVNEDDGWPVSPDRAGRALLEGLGLPAALLEPTVS